MNLIIYSHNILYNLPHTVRVLALGLYPFKRKSLASLLRAPVFTQAEGFYLFRAPREYLKSYKFLTISFSILNRSCLHQQMTCFKFIIMDTQKYRIRQKPRIVFFSLNEF